MKILAMYLPQFHRIPENDAWWGEGFTDWNAVKAAQPLFEGHDQPRVPIDKNYYDLLDKKTMLWQAELMKEYGIDGMCMYHYRFKDGRMILEQPAQNLLEWKDVNMPFCFCWANETWARSWSSLSGTNAWADTFEKKGQTEGDGILLKQEYGWKDDWEAHFEYLLPFFEDKRYIRIDDKPVFMFYHADKIPCLSAMITCWQEMAKASGLKGIYTYGGYITPERKGALDEVYIHEPVVNKVLLDQSYGKYGHVYSYDEEWEGIINNYSSETISYGGFVSYDDSPRRGLAGYRFDGFSPVKFEKNLFELLNKNASVGNEITFINAWNEWGEGMFLEPDKRYGYRVLEAVRIAKNRFEQNKDQVTINTEKRKYIDTELNRALYPIEKDTIYLHLLDLWMWNRKNGKHIADWLRNKGFNSAAIYGYGLFGKHLLSELLDDGFEVGYKTFKTDEGCPDTGIVINTVVLEHEMIVKKYEKRFGEKIVSLRQILEES